MFEFSTPERLLKDAQACFTPGEEHEFAWTVFYTYNNIPDLIRRNRMTVFQDCIELDSASNRRKAYCFVEPCRDAIESFVARGYKIIVRKPIAGENCTKAGEVVYDLEAVFSDASYPNSKKRHQRIRYPFAFLEREGITVEELSPSNLEETMQLHDKWAAAKLADPKVHKLSFSSGRYKRSLKHAVDRPDMYRAFVFRNKEGQAVAARVFGVEEERAFDISFFGDKEAVKSQTLEYINTKCMKLLLDEGVKSLNAGFTMSPSLKQFKNHYPNKMVYTYSLKSV